ncbi:hypothetical protein [uncultured Mucilaginibacter sp.]|uniref:hypothetical protein n=1 Tax=uncultured Mucilaginibacter sp. TaxID=797541 RepID=UPI0025D81858|nr:hypothetical protein [uncultured Mucilaginibacter sp.]
MESAQNFTLINGVFTPEEGRSLLMNLLMSKEKYHGVEEFSNKIRFGKDESNHETRIKELQTIMEAVKHTSEFALQQQLNLEIRSTIEVKIIK